MEECNSTDHPFISNETIALSLGGDAWLVEDETSKAELLSNSSMFETDLVTAA